MSSAPDSECVRLTGSPPSTVLTDVFFYENDFNTLFIGPVDLKLWKITHKYSSKSLP